MSDTVLSLFDSWCSGNSGDGDKLFALIFADLSRVASALLKNEHKVSLLTGDLVNEAVVRLIKSSSLSVTNAAHLKHLTSRVMRNVLLDEIKRKNRFKNNGIIVTLNVSEIGDLRDEIRFIEMDDTLNRLKTHRADLADITLMKVYGSMSNQEIAYVLDKTPEQIKYAWKTAQIWLVAALQEYAN